MDKFTAGYVECALWCGITENDGPAPTVDDLDSATLAKLTADAQDFATSNRAMLDEANEAGRDDAHLGHNFWLTRNRHGAGFWDCGLGKLGNDLTEQAHAYGEASLYWGDNGMVYSE